MKNQNNYDELSKLIDSDPEWVAGSLIELYKWQTGDERGLQSTIHQNDLGFNAIDAPILSNMSQFYLDRGYLTERQIVFIRKTIKKYINNQLLNLDIKPLPIKQYIPPKIKTEMTAVMLYDKDNKPSSIQVKFSFPKGDNRFRDVLEKVKSLPNRRWIADQKYWKVGLSLEAGDKLKEWGFNFSDGLQEWHDDLKGMTATEIEEIEIPGLKGNPFSYQKKGIAFVESRNGRALVADEMGLGKTLQALGYVQLHPEKRPVVIISPASLKENWKRECAKWLSTNDKIQIVSGRKNDYDLIGDIIIINYDIVDAWKKSIVEYCKDKESILIGDEIHYCKNSQTIRTKAIKELSKIFKHTIFLSGTPIVNRPKEFFNPINMIRPDLFPSYWKFMEEFTNKVYSPWTKSGYEFVGAKNTDKLHKLLTETIMIRRTKKEVLTELPDKTRTVVPFEINNRKDYSQAAEDIVSWVYENEGKEQAKKASRAEVLVEFEKLKQLAVQGKMDAAIEWIQDFLESGEKLIIFATHTLALDLLQEKFKNISVRLDGKTNQKNRQEAVDQFQNDGEIKLFLGNVKAAGVGITLTAASNVAFMELPWTPGDATQAEDRAHRIGQKDNVTIWYLIAQDTIEEDIAKILSDKQKILTAVLDGKETKEGDVLTDLINKLKGE